MDNEEDYENEIRLSIKQLYPQWEIIKKIGQGGSGFVFQIEDKFAFNKEEEICVIKVLNYERASVESSLKILASAKKEGMIQYETMRKLEKKSLYGVVKIFGGHVIDKYPVLRMEYLEKGSLNDNLQNLEYSEQLKIFKEICRIIAHLHKNKIIHRDIKPDNILLTKKLDAKLSDFGLTRENEGKNTVSKGWTSGYVSPEIHLGEKTIKSDIYALGILGVELFTKKSIKAFYPVDYSKLNFLDLADALNNNLRIELNKHKVSKWLVDLLQKATIGDFKKRTITAYELFTAIKKNESASYILSIGNKNVSEFLKSYKGSSRFAVSVGTKIYLAQVEKLEKEISIVGYLVVQESKYISKQNYKISIEDNENCIFKKNISIGIEQATLFKFKVDRRAKKFKKPKEKIKFLVPISHDAEKFIQDNAKSV